MATQLNEDKKALTLKRPSAGIIAIAGLELVAALVFVSPVVSLLVAVSKHNDFGLEPLALVARPALIALALLASAIGLCRLRRIARYFTILGSTLNVVLAPISLWRLSFRHEDAATFVATVAVIGVSGWIVWYLFRPHVKVAFSAQNFVTEEK